LFVMRV